MGQSSLARAAALAAASPFSFDSGNGQKDRGFRGGHMWGSSGKNRVEMKEYIKVEDSAYKVSERKKGNGEIVQEERKKNLWVRV